MPTIRSVDCSNGITIIDGSGKRQLLPANIPAQLLLPQDVENWINQNWLQSPDYQINVHVVSVQPLQVTVYTANIGEIIPPNWWIDPIAAVTQGT